MTARLSTTTTLKGLRWFLPLIIAVLPGIAAKAQMNSDSGIQAASGDHSLGTKVGNRQIQSLGGSCNSGECHISGGTARGNNLFHRLSRLRTTSDINKISLDNLIPGSTSNVFKSVILSNINPSGTYINTPFELYAGSSDLIILSPGGIEIGGLAQFSNVGTLGLSTAENLSIGGEIFHYQKSTPTDLINMTAVINLAQSAFSHNQAEGGNISIKVDDLLNIDADLILHSVGGINIESASYELQGRLKVGGSVDLAAQGKLKTFTEPVTTANISGIRIESESINIHAKGSTNADNTISITDSSATTQSGIILEGKAKSTDASSSYIANTVGINISNTDLSVSKGQIDIDGVGGLGNTLWESSDSSGVIIAGSNLRASSINVKGEGGTSPLFDSSLSNYGVRLYDGTRLDTNSSNDDQSNIFISNEEKYLSGNISIDGKGGEGTLGNGIHSTANVDSAGSINISGTGGFSDNSNSGVVTFGADLKAEKQITIKGAGGQGVDIYDGIGTWLGAMNLEAEEGIIIEGTGGGSTDPEGQDDTFLSGVWSDMRGVWIDSSTLKVNQTSALSDVNNPNNANILISGQPGRPSYQAKELIGAALINSKILTEGGVSITGDGSKVETAIIERGNGILLVGTDLEASSVFLKGFGASATWTDAADDTGELIDQHTPGIVLIESYIDSKRYDNELDGSIEMIGHGGSGNLLLNGVGILGSELVSDSTIRVEGVAGSASTPIEDGMGIGLRGTLLNAKNIDLLGVGGSGSGSLGANGLIIEESTLNGSHSLTLEGQGGKTTNIKEQAINADGISLLEQTSLLSTGLIKVNATGGTTAGKSLASNGLYLEGATIETDGDIEITGSGGIGSSEMEATNGVVIASKFIDDDSLGEIQYPTKITAGQNLSINGIGGTATIKATETKGVILGSAELRAGKNIQIKGTGGTSDNNSDAAGNNQGIYIDEAIIGNKVGLIDLTGRGGNGGYFITGVELNNALFTSSKDINVDGSGGSGDNVNFASGILSKDTKLKSIGGDIKLLGKGGEGTVVEDGHGIYLSNNDIALSDSNKLSMQGTGSEASNQIDSNTNTGTTLKETFINGGSSLALTGTGGTGGKFNTGLEILETDIETEGTIKLDGTGGKGTNIKAAIGIQIGDETTRNSIIAKSIEITGSGGTSTLKEGAINKDGEDTFQETANNVGVGIINSSLISTYKPLSSLDNEGNSLASSGGNISIMGTGGNLSIGEIINPDSNEDIEKISKASFLQGINISTSTINSNDALFISGEAGKPIAGNDNSGTSINQSRLTSAATVATDNSFDNRIEGKAYSGTNNNYGLSIKATDIVSTNQDLNLSGRGGLKASGENNFGIYIGETSSVTVGSISNPSVLNIFGAGGNGTNLTGGILTENTSYEIEGSIKMFGESQGAGGFGNASVEFIQNIDITVSDDALIKGGNDVNINETNINAGGTTTIDALGNVNISKTNITSGMDTNILAQGDIVISSSQLNAMNSILLQADSISTMDVEFNAQEVATISNSMPEDNGDNEKDEVNDSTAKQQQRDKANTNVGSSTMLSAKEIQESHDKSEKRNTNFVASELGLKRQTPLSVQEVQQMLTSGQKIMNISR